MRLLDAELILEQAPPSTPASGAVSLFATTTHRLAQKDSAGNVIELTPSYVSTSKWVTGG